MQTLQIVKKPTSFFNKVESMLLRNEAENNLMLGLTLAAIKNAPEGTDYFFAFAEEKGEVYVSLLQTPGKKIIVANSRPVTNDELSNIIDDLIELNLTIPGIVGPKPVVEQFLPIFQQKVKCRIKLEMEQLIYRLETVNPITPTEGAMRIANESDLHTISKWVQEFSLVTPDTLKEEEATRLATNSVENGLIYLWISEGKIVSMAKKSRPTQNGIVVSLVYTPCEYRKKGYASSLVASLSQHLLDEGNTFCTLYTDLSNPTSNHIYREIGYIPLIESMDYSFIY